MKSNKAIDVNNSQLKNVAAPSAPSDASNKSYVDTAIISAGINGSIDNLTVVDAGDYYVFDVAAPSAGGTVQMIDNGDYLTLVI